MRIVDLAHKDGRAGSERSWLSESGQNGSKTANIRIIWHYNHMMLKFNVDDPADPQYLSMSTGWGSVSDQGGMNRLFRELNLPYYFSRAGGAEIHEVEPRWRTRY
jgi:hypothetical protein